MIIKRAGEDSMIIYCAKQISPEGLAQVLRAKSHLKQEYEPYIVDLLPSYCSILVTFEKISFSEFKSKLKVSLAKSKSSQKAVQFLGSKQHRFPVYYGEEVGVDLQNLAKNKGLSIEEVILLHTRQSYLVYATGFVVGFAYLGLVDKKIQMPRLETPRQQIARGSVGIADFQTGIYPSETSGGWNIIGNCPFDMVQVDWQVGDRVKFESISKEKFLSFGGKL